jgi:hypothetical protein
MFDEKWYRIMQVDAGFYLTPDEPVPYRPAKSKSFIPKVMFFALLPILSLDTILTRNKCGMESLKFGLLLFRNQHKGTQRTDQKEQW